MDLAVNASDYSEKMPAIVAEWSNSHQAKDCRPCHPLECLKAREKKERELKREEKKKDQ